MHSPATGLSFAFVTAPDWRWSTIALVVLVDVVVVVMSVLILNLSESHQYPLWWFGLGWPSTGGTQKYVDRIVQRAKGRADDKSPRGPRESLKDPKPSRRASLFEQGPRQTLTNPKPASKGSLFEQNQDSVEATG